MQVRNNQGYPIIVLLCTVLLLLCMAHGSAQERVSETVHNLSASGPGSIHAVTEEQVCIFCHAPHNTSGMQPLWNRDLPKANYQIYQSSTLDAIAGQPTGSSKLCLSCHDGTIALGQVMSRSDIIRMNAGDFLPSDLSNLGTDLSDDHPISFRFTPGLAVSDPQLAYPGTLHPSVKLDNDQRLQCTTCHDPHNNIFGDFLVMNNQEGRLCTTCHEMTGWNSSAHRLSGANVSGLDFEYWKFSTVADNACRCCHRSHLAGGRERLLIFKKEEDNCLDCHNGQVTQKNILAEIQKSSVHDPRRYLGKHDPIENRWEMQPHVECADCHNAHAVLEPQPGSSGTQIGPTLTHMHGVDMSGMDVENAQYEYEICFRCHSDNPVPITGRILRQAYEENLRLKFKPTNTTFHPMNTPSPGPDTVSLIPEMPSGSLIRCTDCHNNDSGPRAGSSGPDGPHGSIYGSLLERNYITLDDTIESSFAYALCYKCHRRASILNNESFPLHRMHIVEERTPCSACHDPHGVSSAQTAGSDHTNLINFDTSIVQQDPVTGKLEFRDLGRYSGQCTLLCHGERHDGEDY